jgi:hypothetical protein
MGTKIAFLSNSQSFKNIKSFKICGFMRVEGLIIVSFLDV